MTLKAQHRTGDVVAFEAAYDVREGYPVEVCNDTATAVIPILDGSRKFVGVSTNTVAKGGQVDVKLRRPIYELTADGDVTGGDRLETVSEGVVRVLTDGDPVYIALGNAASGAHFKAIRINL